MFIDNSEIFLKANCQLHAYLLQYDLNVHYEGCTNNSFILNINKCHIMVVKIDCPELLDNFPSLFITRSTRIKSTFYLNIRVYVIMQATLFALKL